MKRDLLSSIRSSLVGQSELIEVEVEIRRPL